MGKFAFLDHNVCYRTSYRFSLLCKSAIQNRRQSFFLHIRHVLFHSHRFDHLEHIFAHRKARTARLRNRNEFSHHIPVRHRFTAHLLCIK